MKTQAPDPLLTPPSRQEIMAPIHRARIALDRFTAGLLDQAAFDRETREFVSATCRISARIAACERAAELAARLAEIESDPGGLQIVESEILRRNSRKTGYFVR